MLRQKHFVKTKGSYTAKDIGIDGLWCVKASFYVVPSLKKLGEFLDIPTQTKGSHTVDFYPEGHPMEGQLIFYKDWLMLNPYRKLTDVNRWHAIHESLINDFIESKKAISEEIRKSKGLPPKTKELQYNEADDITYGLSKALDKVTNPERALPAGEPLLKEEDIMFDVEDCPQDYEPGISMEEL